MGRCGGHGPRHPLGGLSGVVVTAEARLSVSFLQKLLQAVAKYGEHDWCKIREEVPGRSDTQCRERWVGPAGVGAWLGEETHLGVGRFFYFQASADSDSC